MKGKIKDIKRRFTMKFYEIYNPYYAMLKAENKDDATKKYSVSHKDKILSWEVMNEVKDMFFLENEVVMQLHPIKDKYINNHKKCLHLWRLINEKIPTPPIWMVGVK